MVVVTYGLSELWFEARLALGIAVFIYCFLKLKRPLNSFVRHMMAKELTALLSLPVSVESVDIDLFCKYITITNLRIDVPPVEVDDRWDGDNIISVAAIKVELIQRLDVTILYFMLSLTELIIIKSVTVDGLKLNVEV